MTMTIRPTSTIVLIGLQETNTIGYYKSIAFPTQIFRDLLIVPTVHASPAEVFHVVGTQERRYRAGLSHGLDGPSRCLRSRLRRGYGTPFSIPAASSCRRVYKARST